jgi:hypothetical protein
MFQLKRKNSNADWYLTALDRKGNDSGLAITRPVRALTERTLLCGYKIGDLNLTEVLAEANDCKIQRIATIQKDGIELVQVDFDSSHPIRRLPFSPTQGGMFLLDPSHRWCVLEYNLRVSVHSAAAVFSAGP